MILKLKKAAVKNGKRKSFSTELGKMLQETQYLLFIEKQQKKNKQNKNTNQSEGQLLVQKDIGWLIYNVVIGQCTEKLFTQLEQQIKSIKN